MELHYIVSVVIRSCSDQCIVVVGETPPFSLLKIRAWRIQDVVGQNPPVPAERGDIWNRPDDSWKDSTRVIMAQLIITESTPAPDRFLLKDYKVTIPQQIRKFTTPEGIPFSVVVVHEPQYAIIDGTYQSGNSDLPIQEDRAPRVRKEKQSSYNVDVLKLLSQKKSKKDASLARRHDQDAKKHNADMMMDDGNPGPWKWTKLIKDPKYSDSFHKFDDVDGHSILYQYDFTKPIFVDLMDAASQLPKSKCNCELVEEIFKNAYSDVSDFRCDSDDQSNLSEVEFQTLFTQDSSSGTKFIEPVELKSCVVPPRGKSLSIVRPQPTTVNPASLLDHSMFETLYPDGPKDSDGDYVFGEWYPPPLPCNQRLIKYKLKHVILISKDPPLSTFYVYRATMAFCSYIKDRTISVLGDAVKSWTHNFTLVPQPPPLPARTGGIVWRKHSYFRRYFLWLLYLVCDISDLHDKRMYPSPKRDGRPINLRNAARNDGLVVVDHVRRTLFMTPTFPLLYFVLVVLFTYVVVINLGVPLLHNVDCQVHCNEALDFTRHYELVYDNSWYTYFLSFIFHIESKYVEITDISTTVICVDRVSTCTFMYAYQNTLNVLYATQMMHRNMTSDDYDRMVVLGVNMTCNTNSIFSLGPYAYNEGCYAWYWETSFREYVTRTCGIVIMLLCALLLSKMPLYVYDLKVCPAWMSVLITECAGMSNPIAKANAPTLLRRYFTIDSDDFDGFSTQIYLDTLAEFEHNCRDGCLNSTEGSLYTP